MLHPLFPWWWLLYPSLLVPNRVSAIEYSLLQFDTILAIDRTPLVPR
jgi:hypothetical protein